MAEIFDFNVNDNRTITFKLSEPIMLEDNGVSDWRFHIPNTVNGLDATGWQWWLVYVNAKNEKYTIPLTLEYDYDRPDAYSIATYTVDYGMSCKVGNVRFSLEAIDADTGGTILHEWHTKTYSTNVVDTLQGNQVEYAETESDIISALLIEVRNRTNQLIGGATPTPVSAVSEMLDTDKLYLLTTDGEWYYYNGTAWVSGGVYGAGVVDPVPTQGSANAVSSGGVYEALQSAGLSDNAKTALLACFEHVAWVDEHGQDYYDALESALNASGYWDFEWDAESGELPDGLTYNSASFVTRDNVQLLKVNKPNLDFAYVGDCEIEIVAKWEIENESTSYANSEPQFVIKNAVNGAQADGFKVYCLSPTYNKLVVSNVSGSTASTEIDGTSELRQYNLKFINEEATLKIDGTAVVSGAGVKNNNYLPHTGIATSINSENYGLVIKSIKFKRISE